MANILLIGETRARMDSYALTLSAVGHEVELCRTDHAARERLFGPVVDLVIVDVTTPDSAMGLFCGQASAAWPDVRVLALAPFRDFSHTKLDQMGLWQPTEVLVHPVCDRRLVENCGRVLAWAPKPERREVQQTEWI